MSKKKLMEYYKLFILLTCFPCLSIIECREFWINDTEKPSYLYKMFDKASIDIFPNDVSINTSMSKVAGTLMYSLDGNMNQLIVKLRDALPHIIDIEFNTQTFSASLPSLCGCERCRYETLDLRIQINTYISVLCNGRISHIIKVKNEYKRELNTNYPISKENFTYHDMWLVNTPYDGKVGSNEEQITGCIFDIKNDGDSVSDMNVTDNVGSKCIKACIDDICNGGQCYETYDGKPICNCTSTVLNGRYCNKTLPTYNARLYGQLLEFDMFKLSWNTSVNDFFELKNSKISLSIRHENEILYALYNSSKNGQISMKIVLSNKYVPTNEYIVTAYFRKKRNIDIMLYNDGSWSSIMVPTKIDIRREVFNSILLHSGNGYIDMVYKDEQEYKWRNLNIGPYEEIIYDDPSVKNVYNYKQPLSIFFGIFVPLVVIIAIIWLIICRLKKRKQNMQAILRRLKKL